MPRTFGNQAEHHKAKLAVVEQASRASTPVVASPILMFMTVFAVRDGPAADAATVMLPVGMFVTHFLLSMQLR